MPGGPVRQNAAVTTSGRRETLAASRRSRTLLVTFLGSVVRRMGNWMPIAGTIDLMGQLGLDGPGVRTAVFRLKKRGWLESETRAGARGYALTQEALDALAAGDEVIWHARQQARLEDGWCVITFSIPEARRAKRDQLRAHLLALGFGNVSTATWIAPARMLASAQRAIDELDLGPHCAVFVGQYVAGEEIQELVRRSWDLSGIDQHYRDFAAEFGERERALGAVDHLEPRECFAVYLDMVDRWRGLPFRDPGLPPELLPDDGRAGEATVVFERLVTLLEGRALGHAARSWPSRTS
jgi:phenylacetic acid degradation operon negative regulatory protein